MAATFYNAQGQILGVGATGAAGQGVPTGGAMGEVLTKQSGADFDTDWEATPGGGVSESLAIAYAVAL